VRSAVKILDIGCGNRKKEGAVGLDLSPDSQADIIHDLNSFPYPLPSHEFDRIYCLDVLEHLKDVIRTMEEVHRLSRKGAEVFIRVPHFTSTLTYGDPTHRHFFNTQSLDFFVEGLRNTIFIQRFYLRKIRFA
jgi:SAM-dependent methyltransferase